MALSAFQSFCERAGRGQFPQLDDRDDLWRLLATITVRKALDTMRHQTRQKRGGGSVLGESALLAGDDGRGEGLAEVLSREPTPEAVARFAEDYDRFLARLARPGAADRRPAPAGGSDHPGDRRRELKVSTKTDRPEAPAHPRHLEPGERHR